ncbi:MAG: RNB domain-containing ribonuclease [Treponema sp.]|nr:RNB domain-containing ribonuclease [Treponema sp.]
MVKEHALAVYKNKPALIKEINQDKIVITLSDGTAIKVREKDIEIIHPGPVGSGDWGLGTRDLCSQSERVGNPPCLQTNIPSPQSPVPSPLHDAWELLVADGASVPLQELAELVFGEFSPAAAWNAYCLLMDGLYFTGNIDAIQARQRELVEADEKKREEKQKASNEREEFLQRLRDRQPYIIKEQRTENKEQEAENVADDRRFIQDVEALAFGKTAKSRTMKDIGLGETPEEAHALLLESGFWTTQINPHPSRFGIALLPARHNPGPPPEENRRDLTHLTAFAIDSPWSHDPDDAISVELNDDKHILYVHVADPAAAIGMDSPVEREARDRGATLYIPEGSFRMIADEALPVFALGLTEISPALTFRMTLNSSGEIDDTAIFPSMVKVSRLTYEEADTMLDNAGTSVLHNLYALAERNSNRRSAAGAIFIDMPEIHISMEQGQVAIEPIVRHRSADMVRECMLLASEGASNWAMQRKVPIPYIEQETGDLPDEILPGMAGSYQLRRCMRPRILSAKPGRHWGLGLDSYSQVTSPLRRYTDLLAHIQIRAFLGGGKPLPADELAARIAAGEAAGSAVTQAERASRNHWIMVYLSDKKNSVWDAIALEKKGTRWAMVIPALALETQVPIRKDITPNDPLKLILKSVNIPCREAMFAVEE